jgi:2'-hydroxyisoflavone reductase
LVIRPGLIVGPHDPTDRFTYWPVRVARGGDVLAPDRPDVLTQIIDVRDLSDFTIKTIEENTSGVFNATGPEHGLGFGTMLETCKRVSGSDARFHWASPEFMERHKVEAWSDMPAYLPETGSDAAWGQVDVSKAIRAGLQFRPLEDTVRDTLSWANTRPADHEWRAGLKPEREQELLNLLNG